MFKNYLLVLLFLLLSTVVNAIDESTVGVFNYSLTDSRVANLNELNQLNFKELPNQGIDLGFYKGGVWLKTVYDNDPINNIISIDFPIMDKAVLFIKKDGLLIAIDSIGDYIPFDNRAIKSRIPVFQLPDSQGNIEEYYIFIANNGEQLNIRVKLQSLEELKSFETTQNSFFAFYFGIIIFAFLFNTFVTIILKEKNIQYYILYLLGLIGLQLALSGYGNLYLWGDLTYISTRATVFFASFSIFFLVRFTRLFLNTAKHLIKYDLALKWSNYFILINILATLVLPQNELFIPIVFINIITFIFGVAIIPISWKILKNNFKPGLYFLTAFLFLIIGVLLFVLRNLGLIESNIITEHGIQIGSGFEVVLLTFAIIDKFKSFKDESLQRLQELNKLKEDANEVLEQQVADRTKSLQKSNELIKQQKNSLEDQNLQITSSITYAQKIQLSILPEFSTLKEGVTDLFVSFLPKDIVSGDFYWKNNVNQQQFFSVIDCTGHGVPGAFMSMIGYTLLNQIVNEQQITEPKDILNKLRDEIISALKQSEEGSSQKDGMDLSLIAYHPDSNTIKFAGANNPLYIIRSEENDIIVDEEIQEAKVILDQNKLYELKANKQPVGYYTNESITFTQQEIKVQKGDRIYLFTDGFVDQFGGKLGKKIKSKTFRKLLLESSQKPLNEQKQILELFLTQWINHPNVPKDEQFQIDDVCIMGIEI